jgi:hypothetical protein
MTRALYPLLFCVLPLLAATGCGDDDSTCDGNVEVSCDEDGCTCESGNNAGEECVEGGADSGGLPDCEVLCCEERLLF